MQNQNTVVDSPWSDPMMELMHIRRLSIKYLLKIYVYMLSHVEYTYKSIVSQNFDLPMNHLSTDQHTTHMPHKIIGI